VTGKSCAKRNERESTWRKSGSCQSRGTTSSHTIDVVPNLFQNSLLYGELAKVGNPHLAHPQQQRERLNRKHNHLVVPAHQVELVRVVTALVQND
jgi:hypothetical protein